MEHDSVVGSPAKSIDHRQTVRMFSRLSPSTRRRKMDHGTRRSDGGTSPLVMAGSVTGGCVYLGLVVIGLGGDGDCCSRIGGDAVVACGDLGSVQRQ